MGMGGGGDVDVGGGVLLRAGVEGVLHLAGDLGLAAEAGFTGAPQGSFAAAHMALAIEWVLDDRMRQAGPAPTVRTEWLGGIETYRAARVDGTTRELQSVVLRVNRFVSTSIYVSGQARSAAGGGAGGYTVGLFGLGTQGSLGGGLRGSAEFLLGAAGGGGVDTGGGIVTQPMLYVGYDAAPGLVVRLGTGLIKSVRGPLQGTVIEASVGFAFGVASRHVP